QIINREKSMSPPTAEKIAKAFAFSFLEKEYLLLLLKLDSSQNPEKHVHILGAMREIAAKAKSPKIKDASIQQHWLYQVIWVLAHTRGFRDDVDWIQQALRFRVSVADIEASLAFLKEAGLLIQVDSGRAWKPRDVEFVAENDVK